MINIFNVIGIDKPELEELLSFFSGGSDRYDCRTVDREAYTGAPYRTIIDPIKFFIYRYQNDNEIIIDIYDVSDVRTTFIRDLYENLSSIANNDYKGSLFEKFVQKTKILKTLGLIYNTETPLKQGDELHYLFHEITNLMSEFGDELFDFGVELCRTIRHLPKLVNRR